MNKAMHIILKYRNSIYNVDTIREHKDVLEEKGQVIWGIIKPNPNSVGIGSNRIESINNQVEEDIDTYAFMCSGGEINFRGKVKKYLNKDEINYMREYVPEYYRKDLDNCVGGVLMSKIEPQSPDVLEYMRKYDKPNENVVVSNQTNPLYTFIEDEYNLGKNIKEDNTSIDTSPIEVIEDIKELINFVHKYINSKGFIYSREDLCNFYLSLKTKPFVILAGISGTGKSRLVRLFADALGSNIENERLSIIPVRPDWSDNTELIGHKNITGEFIPGKLVEVIEKAMDNPQRPFFICLDEMNLARVEYYLSDYLSIIESREQSGNKIITDKIFTKNFIQDSKYKDIILPENLYLIGTVNMDDTTYAFSRKVLDRANTIELSKVELDLVDFTKMDLTNKFVHNNLLKSNFLNIKDALEYDKEYVTKVNEFVKELNNILSLANKQFGYRVRDEIVFYMLENKIANLLKEDEAYDYQIMQKILPTISGSDSRIKNVLIKLFNLCSPKNQISYSRDYINEAIEAIESAIYKKSAKKIVDMLRELEDGFTSYWV